MHRPKEGSGVPDALWRLAVVLADIASNTPKGSGRGLRNPAFPVGRIRSDTSFREPTQPPIPKATKVSS